jgi:hypothetical protein
MKIARILDESGDTFGLEYDNTQGTKNTMRLDALTYEKAIREAKAFLGIEDNGQDADGNLWVVDGI